MLSGLPCFSQSMEAIRLLSRSASLSRKLWPIEEEMSLRSERALHKSGIYAARSVIRTESGSDRPFERAYCYFHCVYSSPRTRSLPLPVLIWIKDHSSCKAFPPGNLEVSHEAVASRLSQSTPAPKKAHENVSTIVHQSGIPDV